MRRVPGILAAVLLLPACEPDDVPRFAPDGRQAAFLADAGLEPGKDPVPVGVADLDAGKSRILALPDRWSAGGVVWAGARLLVSSSRPTGKLDDKGKPELETAAWLLDPATGKAERSSLGNPLAEKPFHGVWKGKPCLYVPGPEQMKALELPDLKELAVLPIDADHAGDGWMSVDESAEAQGGLTRSVVAVRILDPDGKEAGRIPRDEIAKASFRDARFPEIVRVSDDRKRVLLGFDTDTLFRQLDAEYTFGVYDLATGGLDFQGKSNALRGVPVLLGDAVYVLEAKSRAIYTGERTVAALGSGAPPRGRPTSDVVLARHDRDGRRIVLEIPLGKENRATRYSASDDRKRFLLQVEGAAPKLLLIPVGDAVRADQLKEVPVR